MDDEKRSTLSVGIWVPDGTTKYVLVSHVGLSPDGTVSMRGENLSGEPYSIEIRGSDAAGRSIGACLVELAKLNETHTGRSGL